MKSYEVYLTPDAIQDLTDIYEYIAAKSGLPEVAWAYIEKLRQKCHDLKTIPLIGQQRDDLRKNLRIVAIDKNAIAAFEVNEINKASPFLISFMVVEIMKQLWVVKRRIKMLS
jgi:toxin ParE1/3/4